MWPWPHAVLITHTHEDMLQLSVVKNKPYSLGAKCLVLVCVSVAELLQAHGMTLHHTHVAAEGNMCGAGGMAQ
jgi:L-ascorbate metabolism protein UlaG (beta-lactamase superfamily)